MKLFATALVAASAVVAAPLEKRAVTDADILQYALTLEHLENVFYKGALSKFTEDDFVGAGFSKEYYDNLKYIATDEESHVTALSDALKKAGAMPVAACTYDFPYTDPKSFVAVSAILEGVGTSAYLGSAGLIQDKTYLGVAGSILVTEALHTSLQRFSLGQIAPANPYGTGLGINEVYTLAAAFIKSCPDSNVKLPVMAFPTLTSTTGMPTAPGVEYAFMVKDAPPAGPCFVTFLSGLSITSVPAMVMGTTITAMVPETAMGQSYAVLTKSNVTDMLTDDMVIAGPAVVEVTPPSPQYDVNLL